MLERVDIRELLRQYKPGGTSSYHPRMLLKVLVFAYINNIYSSRKIEVANNYMRLKQKAEKRLKTKRGVQKRKQRCFDTEPVFANIKYNLHFRRFMLRGLEKVSVETGLLAHNLRKNAA